MGNSSSARHSDLFHNYTRLLLLLLTRVSANLSICDKNNFRAEVRKINSVIEGEGMIKGSQIRVECKFGKK